ncbi:MLP-like protein 34 [Rhodamnia argentea]|uniref:MLP-like protein 34 n=1 Tax=Rhodamnia argentea TaxID=178133 RepID=A0ABM3HLD3_9MYRT|nr:MLP-like protein 34 [Rhodamnia argentea]
MAVRGKMEVEVDLESSAYQFYSFFRNTPHHLPKVCSDLHAGEIHEGEWVSGSSTRKWTYSVNSKKETFKEKVEFDDENKSVTHVGVEGDVFDYYKSYRATWQAVARGGGPAIAKMIIEYEKLDESMPHPVNYLDFMANVTKDIDAHLVKA